MSIGLLGGVARTTP